MLSTLQRLVARIAAIAAILLGAAVAVVLGIVTLLTGLVIGLIAAIAAWFGARSRRNAGQGPFGPAGGRDAQPRPGSGTVIDVEMREIDRDAPRQADEPSAEPRRDRGGD